MGDSCCPIEFICEHYLAFSKSLLGFIHRGKGELENAKGNEYESMFTFKMAF